MAFFGRKKEEKHDEMYPDMPSLSSLDQPQLLTEQSKSPPSQPAAKKEPEKPTIAPLFVKVERYRQIISTIGNLKTALVVVKNSLGTLQHIEKLRNDTLNIVNELVENMDGKIANLDNDLLRPAGFHDSGKSSPERQDIRSIEATVSDLHGQIEQLKSEIGNLTR